jgi:uncharacterized phage protein (TIGR02220 family)
MIRQQPGTLTTIITICNYESYQALTKGGKAAGNTADDAAPRQHPGSTQGTIEECKEREEGKEQHILPGKPDVKATMRKDSIEVLNFLNDKAGRCYKPVDSNINTIMARFKEGYTKTELFQIIAKKCREWNADPDMMQYLRPATLFNATKCAQYSGELVAPGGNDR